MFVFFVFTFLEFGYSGSWSSGLLGLGKDSFGVNFLGWCTGFGSQDRVWQFPPGSDVLILQEKLEILECFFKL